MSVLFTAALGFVGCVSTSESSDPSQPQTSEAQADDQSVAGLNESVESVEAVASCSSAGGVCRKSACRIGEVLNNRLTCGTDAACCVPVQ